MSPIPRLVSEEVETIEHYCVTREQHPKIRCATRIPQILLSLSISSTFAVSRGSTPKLQYHTMVSTFDYADEAISPEMLYRVMLATAIGYDLNGMRTSSSVWS
jgi:hypothetical protein